MHQQRCPHIILCVVVDHGGACDDVEIDAVRVYVVARVVEGYVGHLVADGRGERQVCQTVLGKYPVVAVAEVQAVVGISHGAEAHTLVQLRGDGRGQLLVVEGQFVARVGQARQQRARAPSLVGRLAVGRGVGEPAVVEDVVEVYARHLRLQAVKADFGVRPDAFEALHARQFEVLAALEVVEVCAHLCAVEAQVELVSPTAVPSAAEQVVCVDRPSDEYPPPADVGSEPPSRRGRETEALVSAVGRYAIVLVGSQRVEHEGEVVAVWGDVERVGIVEVDELRHPFQPGAFLPVADGVGTDAVRRFSVCRGAEQRQHEEDEDCVARCHGSSDVRVCPECGPSPSWSAWR